MPPWTYAPTESASRRWRIARLASRCWGAPIPMRERSPPSSARKRPLAGEACVSADRVTRAGVLGVGEPDKRGGSRDPVPGWWNRPERRADHVRRRPDQGVRRRVEIKLSAAGRKEGRPSRRAGARKPDPIGEMAGGGTAADHGPAFRRWPPTVGVAGSPLGCSCGVVAAADRTGMRPGRWKAVLRYSTPYCRWQKSSRSQSDVIPVKMPDFVSSTGPRRWTRLWTSCAGTRTGRRCKVLAGGQSLLPVIARSLFPALVRNKPRLSAGGSAAGVAAVERGSR